MLTHCYGHALNLAIGDSMKQSKVCRNAMDTAYEIYKLLRFSPKRHDSFDRIRVESLAVEDAGPRAVGIWAMALQDEQSEEMLLKEMLLKALLTLCQLWDERLETQLENYRCTVCS